MCGIVAVHRFDGQLVDAGELQVMRDQMEHRGPDDAGLYVDGRVGLGHRRLSIVDLTEAGHQPMSNEDGTIWVVFNGEIYNFIELRRELAARGHRFSSHTDTEVIVHLYEDEGERCVDRLRGMFGFVIWDSRRQVLFGARDRIGIKPFYYFADDRQFVCASEVKAILAGPGVPCAADHVGVADYLYAGYPQADRTLFAGIRQLLPGHSITIDRDGLRTTKYWDLEYRYDRTRDDRRVTSDVEELLDEAVRLHCRSDASLGCHLSGGLDSSTVTGLATRHRGALETFSIRFADGGWYDETEFARALAAYAGAKYIEAVPDASEFADAFPGLVWHIEMPLPSLGGFSYFTVSRLASEYVKVTLTGHGGDEVFAGYPAQFITAYGVDPTVVKGVAPERPRGSLLERGNAWLGRLSRRGARGVAQGLARRLGGENRTPEELWLALHVGDLPGDHPILSRRFVDGLQGYSPMPDYLAAFRDAPTDELLDRCLYHDLRSYLPGLLHMEDRVSMSVSVESRVPLLDHRLVEYMATVPPSQKVPGLLPKALLRAGAGAAIPDLIRDRQDKRPFPVPFDAWARADLKALSDAVLQAPQALDRGVLEPDALRRGRLSPDMMWAALNLELWFRVFIDHEPVWIDRARSLRRPSIVGRGRA